MTPFHLGKDNSGIFCSGTIIFNFYILLPAHCLAAGKKLKNYRFKIQSENGTLSDITVNRETFLVHPNFRINSYDKRRFLINDIAIVAIKTDQEQESAKIDIDTQSDVTNYMNLMVTDSFKCDKRGLSECQQCFRSKIKREGSRNKSKGTYLKYPCNGKNIF